MGVLASQGFVNGLRQSHTALQRVAAYNEVGVNLDVDTAWIVRDLDDPTRTSLDMTVLNLDGYSVSDMQTLLDPFVARYQAFRGMVVPSTGLSEYVNCGWFYGTEVEAAEAQNGAQAVAIKSFDRSCRLQDDLTTPYYAPPGTNCITAAQGILTSKDPTIRFQMAPTAFTTPALVVTSDQDPWAEARRLVAATGKDLYIDRDDNCTTQIRAMVADPNPFWTYTEGANADFWDVKRSTGNDAFPNVVVVIGTNPSFPGISGIAYDNDPTSPTYRYGKRKERVVTFRSEQVTSTGMAQELANFYLRKLLGPQDVVTFGCIPNPLLDVGDSVALTKLSEGLSGTRMLVTHIEMPLHTRDGDDMRVTCRRSVLTDATGGLLRP